MSFGYMTYKKMVFVSIEKRFQNFLKEYEVEFMRKDNYLTILKLDYFDKHVLSDFVQKLDTSSSTFPETQKSLEKFKGILYYFLLFIKKNSHIDLDMFSFVGKKMRIVDSQLEIYDDSDCKIKIYYNFAKIEKEVEEYKKELIQRCKDYKFDIKGLDIKSLIEIFYIFNEDEELKEVLNPLMDEMFKTCTDSSQVIEEIFNYDPYKDPSFDFIKNIYKEYKNGNLVKDEEDKYKDDLSRYQGYLINKISGLNIKDYYDEDDYDEDDYEL